jgi:hypothetical protein
MEPCQGQGKMMPPWLTVSQEPAPYWCSLKQWGNISVGTTQHQRQAALATPHRAQERQGSVSSYLPNDASNFLWGEKDQRKTMSYSRRGQKSGKTLSKLVYFPDTREKFIYYFCGAEDGTRTWFDKPCYTTVWHGVI